VFLFCYIQCKTIEENNRMGKTGDIFKKITDAKAGDRKEGWIPDPWLGKIPWSREWLNSQYI